MTSATDPGTVRSGSQRPNEDRRRADLLDAAIGSAPALAGGDVPDLASYLAQYYAHVAIDDLASADPVDLVGAALSHRQLGAHRTPGVSKVRVHTPTVDEHGWSNGHTVVEIITDDMPFLVDSVSAALSTEGRAIHLVIHPQFEIRRDDDGQLLDVLGLMTAETRAGSKSDTIVESWIHFDIDRESDADDLSHLADVLTRVLGDVRSAVEDWPDMRAEAAELAEFLAPAPISSLAVAEQKEAAAFLTWMAEGQFTFLGYRQYDVVDGPDGRSLAVVPGTGRGILRGGDESVRTLQSLSESVRAKALEPAALVLTKANSRSTVHRSAYLDYVGVKRFDDSGVVIGEHRFLGLYAATAYNQSVLGIPVLRAKVAAVAAASGFPADSHSGKDLLQFLETYPRDELFQAPVEELLDTALSVLHIQERRRTRVFLRRDAYERFMSCLVYLPRDRYTTTVRLRIEQILKSALNADSLDYRTRVTESVLARLHFVVRVAEGHALPHPDQDLLEQEIANATRSWEDSFAEELAGAVGEESGAELLARFGTSVPEAYKEAFPARTGVSDMRHLAQLGHGATELNLYRPYEAGDRVRRLKIYRSGTSVSLSRILPMLQHLGVEVTDERPFTMTGSDGEQFRIYDLGLVFPDDPIATRDSIKSRFEEAFLAIWGGSAESDGFNALVTRAELHWREAALLRAISKYMRQSQIGFSQAYIEHVLVTHPQIAKDLVALFRARFDPQAPDGADREQAQQVVVDRLTAQLDEIASLDVDRILRFMLMLIRSCVRTSYYQHQDDQWPFKISFKLRPALLPELPDPRPKFEIWVCSPQVEGVHLRFAKVARGGLRWSDRPEDFRTEVLGLVKAQAVKNAVIVPAGAKGGFFAKNLPDPAVDRERWVQAGRDAYRAFISGLLDLTDNRRDGEVVPPERVVRHDEPDPYLVVAADKGTAMFSDLANSVSSEYDYWLGDAFASGGSVGYDHKEMGITARGAWESVKRHFRELGLDTQTQEFTCVGIGDMSGDVFGNGMLLSDHIKLLAAFDHRHVFLDPDPDPAVARGERQRIFDMPRSSWLSYEPALLSAGGGIYPRSAKSIPVTPEVRAALAIESEAETLTPNEMIRAILRAPVGLLWNGGIGTYVKASAESHSDVGDKTNDMVRVDARELRCSVVAEGGNLGLTQRGRIEAARAGVRLNTDAIDNSAGVDTSDHEVNIKILIDRVVEQGDLTVKQRSELLESMTGTVAQLVLGHNHGQNLALGNARSQAADMITVHGRMMRALVAKGELDRDLEFLPSDEELHERELIREGLTSPELAVLLAYAKMSLLPQVAKADLASDPYFLPVLHAYFPAELEPYESLMGEHPLASEIINTVVVNDLVNRGGVTFAFRMNEETGAGAREVVNGYTFARDVFDLPSYWARVQALDNLVPTDTTSRLHLEARRLSDRTARWLVQTRGFGVDLTTEVATHRPVIAELAPQLEQLLRGAELERLHETAAAFEVDGVPHDLALETASLLYQFMLLDVARIVDRTGAEPLEVAQLYFCVSERYQVDDFLTRITTLPRDGRWKALARQALRSDLYQALASLTAQIVRKTDPGSPAAARLDAWEAENGSEVRRVRGTLAEIAPLEGHDLASLSVALRAMRTLLTQARS